MNNKEFASEAVDVCSFKTLYVKGGFGQPLNNTNKKKLLEQYPYNQNISEDILNASDDTFAFDCCGMVKSIIWGFNGNKKLRYGGAKYKSNGMDDLNEKGILNICSDLSDDFSLILEGEFLYMSGHCGIYIGNNLVAESSPKWKNGAQITDIKLRKWKCHGKLPMIDYTGTSGPTYEFIPKLAKYYLKNGSKGVEVYNLQRDLNFCAYKYDMDFELETDGIFGPQTKKALIIFQTKFRILADGVYGPQSYNKMWEVMNK